MAVSARVLPIMDMSINGTFRTQFTMAIASVREFLSPSPKLLGLISFHSSFSTRENRKIYLRLFF